MSKKMKKENYLLRKDGTLVWNLTEGQKIIVLIIITLMAIYLGVL